ncbi:hypothetical protein Agub_g6917 [Astrephomene gubernaculifera]|uniref:Uncharacterized protein n=1 Tax=Astrephomene gubernaculifera TaxID=47775 RepID=A0AAD3DP91_9CHLO|nr:hypothetical protein Agub_g6917 [Astrephomene gubernaculifera]
MGSNVYSRQLGQLSNHFLTQQELQDFHDVISNESIREEVESALAVLYGEHETDPGLLLRGFLVKAFNDVLRAFVMFPICTVVTHNNGNKHAQLLMLQEDEHYQQALVRLEHIWPVTREHQERAKREPRRTLTDDDLMYMVCVMEIRDPDFFFPEDPRVTLVKRKLLQQLSALLRARIQGASRDRLQKRREELESQHRSKRTELSTRIVADKRTGRYRPATAAELDSIADEVDGIEEQINELARSMVGIEDKREEELRKTQNLVSDLRDAAAEARRTMDASALKLRAAIDAAKAAMAPAGCLGEPSPPSVGGVFTPSPQPQEEASAGLPQQAPRLEGTAGTTGAARKAARRPGEQPAATAVNGSMEGAHRAKRSRMDAAAEEAATQQHRHETRQQPLHKQQQQPKQKPPKAPQAPIQPQKRDLRREYMEVKADWLLLLLENGATNEDGSEVDLRMLPEEALDNAIKLDERAEALRGQLEKEGQPVPSQFEVVTLLAEQRMQQQQHQPGADTASPAPSMHPVGPVAAPAPAPAPTPPSQQSAPEVLAADPSPPSESRQHGCNDPPPLPHGRHGRVKQQQQQQTQMQSSPKSSRRPLGANGPSVQHQGKWHCALELSENTCTTRHQRQATIHTVPMTGRAAQIELPRAADGSALQPPLTSFSALIKTALLFHGRKEAQEAASAESVERLISTCPYIVPEVGLLTVDKAEDMESVVEFGRRWGWYARGGDLVRCSKYGFRPTSGTATGWKVFVWVFTHACRWACEKLAADFPKEQRQLFLQNKAFIVLLQAEPPDVTRPTNKHTHAAPAESDRSFSGATAAAAAAPAPSSSQLSGQASAGGAPPVGAPAAAVVPAAAHMPQVDASSAAAAAAVGRPPSKHASGAPRPHAGATAAAGPATASPLHTAYSATDSAWPPAHATAGPSGTLRSGSVPPATLTGPQAAACTAPAGAVPEPPPSPVSRLNPARSLQAPLGQQVLAQALCGGEAEATSAPRVWVPPGQDAMGSTSYPVVQVQSQAQGYPAAATVPVLQGQLPGFAAPLQQPQQWQPHQPPEAPPHPPQGFLQPLAPQPQPHPQQGTWQYVDGTWQQYMHVAYHSYPMQQGYLPPHQHQQQAVYPHGQVPDQMHWQGVPVAGGGPPPPPPPLLLVGGYPSAAGPSAFAMTHAVPLGYPRVATTAPAAAAVPIPNAVFVAPQGADPSYAATPLPQAASMQPLGASVLGWDGAGAGEASPPPPLPPGPPPVSPDSPGGPPPLPAATPPTSLAQAQQQPHEGHDVSFAFVCEARAGTAPAQPTMEVPPKPRSPRLCFEDDLEDSD